MGEIEYFNGVHRVAPTSSFIFWVQENLQPKTVNVFQLKRIQIHCLRAGLLAAHWETFNNNRSGYGSAVAVILFILVLPFIVYQLWQVRRDL